MNSSFYGTYNEQARLAGIRLDESYILYFSKHIFLSNLFGY